MMMHLFHKRWLACLALAVVAVPGRAADADKLLPGDAEGVLVVNVRQLLDSAVVKKFGLEPMKAALKKEDKVAKPLADAGIDPFKDIDTILLTASGNPADNKMLIVVRGRFDLDKIQSTAEELTKKGEGQLKVHKSGDLRVYETRGKEGEKPAFLAFVDNTTLIASPSKEYVTEVAKGDSKGLGKPNKEMAGALTKVNDKASVWLALVVTEQMKKVMAKNPQTAGVAEKLEAITGSLNLSDFLLATINIHTADAQAANQVEMLVNQFKPFLNVLAQADEKAGPIINELLQNLKIDKTKNSVSISLKVNEDLVEKLNKQGEK
jgi:hypothetical protein